MKIPRLTFKSVAPLGLSLISLTASAATQLPYFGPDQMDCGVRYPTGAYAELDAGFVPSEDCSYIYILPPKTGIFETQAIQAPSTTQIACTHINQAIEGLMTVNATPGTPEYNTATLRALGLLRNYQNTVKETFTAPAAYASGSASFDWNGLIRAYQDANPGLKWGSQFIAMPIRAGVLSMASARSVPGSLGEFENELYSVRVSSYLPPAGNASTASTDSAPLYLSFLEGDRSSFIMGQSVGLEVRYGMLAACGLSENAQASQSLSGTYTYVYPVQSKGLVRYEFNKDKLIPMIQNFINSRRDSFTTEDLLKLIKDTQAFNIVINEGAFSDTRINNQIEDFKDDLTAKAGEIMLSLLANQSSISLKASTWIETNTHSQKKCHGAWFLKKCSTHVWVTKTSHVNWEQFANDLSQNLSVPDISAQAYKTFYIMSTSSIQPKKENI